MSDVQEYFENLVQTSTKSGVPFFSEDEVMKYCVDKGDIDFNSKIKKLMEEEGFAVVLNVMTTEELKQAEECLGLDMLEVCDQEVYTCNSR